MIPSCPLSRRNAVHRPACRLCRGRISALFSATDLQWWECCAGNAQTQYSLFVPGPCITKPFFGTNQNSLPQGGSLMPREENTPLSQPVFSEAQISPDPTVFKTAHDQKKDNELYAQVK